MDRETAIPKSPLGAFLTSPQVREHLAKAGQELAIALQEGLKAVASQVRNAQLDLQYPYLNSAIQNLVATVELVARKTPTGKKERAPKKGKPHGRRTSRS